MNKRKPTTKQPYQWPLELDALTAAPEHHKLIFENDFVRVIDTCIPPGEITALHLHSLPASHIVVSWSDFIRYDADTNILLDSRTTIKDIPQNSAFWGEPLLPHKLKNVGVNKLHIISVEIKPTHA